MEKVENDKKTFWKGKIIGKLLLIATITDLQQLDWKEKLVIYTEVLVKIYN